MSTDEHMRHWLHVNAATLLNGIVVLKHTVPGHDTYLAFQREPLLVSLTLGSLSVRHVGHRLLASSACSHLQAGGRLRHQNVTGLADFAKFDMVINCGGLRGGKLFGDDKVIPVRCRGSHLQCIFVLDDTSIMRFTNCM